MTEIKKVIQRIYEFDFSDCGLTNGNELITTNRGSEFVNTFRKRDLDKGIIVTPSGYSKGLVYRTSNNGEVYNNPEWMPDIVNFSLNIFGLKKNAFYRITVIGRNTRRYNRLRDVTDDRNLRITNEQQELLLDIDLSDYLDNAEFTKIFKADSNETNLYFQMGKVFLNNVIIDEVELPLDIEVEVDDVPETEFSNGKSDICAFAVFQAETDSEKKGRYIELTRLTGKGLVLFFDSLQGNYILERDNVEDTLGASFTNIEYLIDFNFNKLVNNKDYFKYNIVTVSPEISPNTLKQGYIRFELVNKDNISLNTEKLEGRMAFLIRKIY